MGIKILALVSIGLACCAATGTFAKIRNEKDDLITWGQFDDLNTWLVDHSDTDDPEKNLAIIKATREASEFPEHNRAMDILIGVASIHECDDEKLQLVRVAVPGFDMHVPYLKGSFRKIDNLMEHYVRKAVKKCEPFIEHKFHELNQFWQAEGINLDLTRVYPPIADHNEWIEHLYTQRIHPIDVARDLRAATIEVAGQVYNNELNTVQNVFNQSFVKPCEKYNFIMEDLFDTVQELKDLATVGYEHRKDFFKRIPVAFQNGLHQYIICEWIVDIIAQNFNNFWLQDLNEVV